MIYNNINHRTLNNAKAREPALCASRVLSKKKNKGRKKNIIRHYYNSTL